MAADTPLLAEHKRLQGEFMTRLLVLQAQHEQSTRAGLSLEVMSFLEEWSRGHIQGVDRRYIPHLAKAPHR